MRNMLTLMRGVLCEEARKAGCLWLDENSNEGTSRGTSIITDLKVNDDKVHWGTMKIRAQH